jgi:hypothetical protein
MKRKFRRGHRVEIVGGRWKGVTGVVEKGTNTEGALVFVKVPMIDYWLPIFTENLVHE